METDKEYLKDRSIIGVISESVGEFILPDYYTDVKKMLYVNARCVQSGLFVDGDTVECVGVVCYDAVYLDSENNITHCEFTTDYEVSAKCSEDDYKAAHAATRVANFNVRPIGPRRLSAKATLHTDLHIIENEVFEMEGDVFREYEPETLEKVVGIATAAVSERVERELAEELTRIDGVIADEVDVLISSVEPRVISVTVNEGAVEQKGEMIVSSLVKVGDDVPVVYRTTIPFAVTLPFEEYEEGMDVSSRVELSSQKVETNPTEEGVSITVSIIFESVAVGYGNLPLRLINDCYLCDRGVKNEYADFSYVGHVGTFSESCQLEFECERSEVGAQDLRNVLFSDASARVDSVTMEDRDARIKGEIRFSGIACEVNEDGLPAYVGVKFDHPFEVKVNNCCQNSVMPMFEYEISLSDVSVALDAERVYLSCHLCASGRVSEAKKERCVHASYTTEECFSDMANTVTVYYPESRESLFEVAKKFHSSVMRIASDNSLSESVFADSASPSLSGVKKLIIK